MTISDLAQILVSVAALLSSIVLALVAYFGGKRIAELEQHRTMRDNWNALNMLALSSPEMLKDAEAIMNPSSADHADDDLRRKWLTFIALNNLATAYMMARKGLTPDREFVFKMTEFSFVSAYATRGHLSLEPGRI